MRNPQKEGVFKSDSYHEGDHCSGKPAARYQRLLEPCLMSKRWRDTLKLRPFCKENKIW